MPSDTVTLAGNIYRLARTRDGAIDYSQAPAPFFPPQIAQTDVVEGNFPPEHRIPYSFRDLSGGSGQAETPLRSESQRYDRVGDAEAEGVDATLTPEGPTVLAPELNTQSLAPAGTDNIFGVLWKGGTNTAYFAAGRYVYSWTGAAFANVGDLGAGLAASDAILTFRGAQSSDTWYAPLGASQTMKFSTDSGATWTAITTSGGVDKVISAVVLDGEVVFAQASPRQGSAMIASFDNGGGTPTLYGVIDPVGDPGFAITRLLVFNGRLLVIKDGEGVFLLTAGRRTLEQELFPELKGAKIYAWGAKVWRGLLWLPTDKGLYAVTPGFVLQHVGPEKTEARSTRSARGLVRAVDGDAHNLYAFRYGGASSAASFLMKARVDVSGGGVQKIAWHDLLQLADGALCESVNVISNPGGNGPKLLVDRETAAGAFTAYWLKLPNRGADPRADSDYRYAAAGTLYYSRLTARFPFSNKTFFGITPLCAALTVAVDGQTATTAQSVRARFKLDTTALTGASPFGYTQGATQNTGVGARDSFALRGRGLDVAARLASSDNTTTPQLHALTPDYDVEPQALWQHKFTIDLTPSGYSRSGRTVPEPMSPNKALSTLRALPGSGVVALLDPWDNSYDGTVPLTGIVPRAGAPRDEGFALDVPLFVNVLFNEQNPRVIGTYGSLANGRTYGQLNAMNIPYSALVNL